MGTNNEDVRKDKPAEHEGPGVAEAQRVLRQEVHRAGVEITLGEILITGPGLARPEKTLVTHDRSEKRLRRKLGAGNILLIHHEPLCNASSFNKAVLKLVENRKLLPHFLSRRARHVPNKKTILCPLGMVSRLMSPLIGCLKTVRASHWPRLTTWQL